MKRRYSIPLSYNPIPWERLSRKLAEFEDFHHNALVDDFELRLRNLTGSGHAVALSSGTAALHLGLKALDVQSGDFVLAPTFTYVASVSPILYLGAQPILVDSESTSWNMDPTLMDAAIKESIKDGRKPKAIIAVHTFGMPANMNAILTIAGHYGIPVLEDAAEAVGTLVDGKPAGTLGAAGIFSFNNNKTLTTYGGGAVLTDQPEMASKILSWSTHSRKPLPYYEHDEIGFNYRMSPLNAAVGSIGLEYLNHYTETRRTIFEKYRIAFEHIPGLGWQKESGRDSSNRWISCFTIPQNLKKVRTVLEEKNIETRPLWKPMHQQPLFAKYKTYLNGTSDRLFGQGLCLPSGQELSTDQVDKIAALVSASVDS